MRGERKRIVTRRIGSEGRSKTDKGILQRVWFRVSQPWEDGMSGVLQFSHLLVTARLLFCPHTSVSKYLHIMLLLSHLVPTYHIISYHITTWSMCLSKVIT